MPSFIDGFPGSDLLYPKQGSEPKSSPTKRKVDTCFKKTQTGPPAPTGKSISASRNFIDALGPIGIIYIQFFALGVSGLTAIGLYNFFTSSDT